MMSKLNKTILTLILLGLSLAIGKETVISAEKPLKIAFTAVVIKENIELNNRLIKYLADKLGRQVQLIYKKSYKEIDHLLERGEIEAAWICGAPYVIDHDRFGVELLATPQVTGYKKGMYRSFVIVPIESTAKSFEDLRGKNYAFADPLSNSGRIVPSYMLATMGETPDSFFKRYIYTYAHYESIQAVAEWFVDGASVDSYIYDAAARFNPDIVKKVRIIEKSEWYGFTPLVVRKGFDQELKDRLRNILFNMRDDPEGSRILEGYGFDGFVNPHDSIYDGIREIMEFISSFEAAMESK